MMRKYFWLFLTFASMPWWIVGMPVQAEERPAPPTTILQQEDMNKTPILEKSTDVTIMPTGPATKPGEELSRENERQMSTTYGNGPTAQDMERTREQDEKSSLSY